MYKGLLMWPKPKWSRRWILWCSSLPQCISIVLREVKGILALMLHWKRGGSISLEAKNAVSKTIEFQLFYSILTTILFYPHGSVGLVWTITISFIDKYIFFLLSSSLSVFLSTLKFYIDTFENYYIFLSFSTIKSIALLKSLLEPKDHSLE